MHAYVGYVQGDYSRQFHKSPHSGHQGSSDTARRRDPTAKSPVPPAGYDQQTPKYTKKVIASLFKLSACIAKCFSC